MPDEVSPPLEASRASGTSVPGTRQEDPAAGHHALVSVVGLTGRHLICLPDPTASGLEGLLGQANRRRLADAQDRMNQIIDLGRLLPDGVADPDSGEGRRRSPSTMNLMLDVGIDELWSAIDLAVLHDDVRPGRLAFGLADAADDVDDQLAFASTYGLHRPATGAIAAKLAGGASMLIHGVDLIVPALDALVADLETVCGRTASAGLVVMPGESAHAEPPERAVDILLVPVESPLRAIAGGVEHVASPGTALLVPSGVGATVATDQGALLVRVEVPVTLPSTANLETSAMARFHPLLRADLPTSLDRPIESYGGSLYESAEAWRSEVVDVLGERARAHSAAWVRANLAPRLSTSGGLLAARAFRSEPRGRVRSPLHAGVMTTEVDARVEMSAAGNVIGVPNGLAELIAPHLDGRSLLVADLLSALAESPTLDRESARQLIVGLVHREILEPVP